MSPFEQLIKEKKLIRVDGETAKKVYGLYRDFNTKHKEEMDKRSRFPIEGSLYVSEGYVFHLDRYDMLNNLCYLSSRNTGNWTAYVNETPEELFENYNLIGVAYNGD